MTLSSSAPARLGWPRLSPPAKSGLSCQVIEKGALVNSLLHYPTEMVFFTTPELMEIGGMPFVSPYDKPTRLEALRYYRRVSDAFKLDIVFDEAVVADDTRRRGARSAGTFVVDTHSARGVRRSVHGRTVVVATGAYDLPNRIGVPGEDLPHVSHYYTQPHPFFRKKVVIVGGKNSAAEAALDLYRAGAKRHDRPPPRGDGGFDQVLGQARHRQPHQGRIDSRRASTRTSSRSARRASSSSADGVVDEIEADAVFLLTGYGSDTTLLRNAGIEIDAETCGPVFDAETFETNVPGHLHRGGDGGRRPERPDLHRERPLPRREGDRGDQREAEGEC